MLVALSGSHRVGKSTLARTVAEKYGFQFVETSTSAVFRELGYDPSAHYDFATRLDIQEIILNRLDRQYASIKAEKAITDRSPIDTLAYTMAEALQDTVSDKEQARFEKYVDKCLEMACRRFAAIVVVQPGIPIVEEEGKGALNRAYMEHLNTLMLGLVADPRMKAAHFYIPRHVLSIESRMAAMDSVLKTCLRRAQEESEYFAIH